MLAVDLSIAEAEATLEQLADSAVAEHADLTALTRALEATHRSGRDTSPAPAREPTATKPDLLRDHQQLEARYRTLVEGIPAVTFLASLDEGDDELYISPQIETLLGYSQREWRCQLRF